MGASRALVLSSFPAEPAAGASAGSTSTGPLGAAAFTGAGAEETGGKLLAAGALMGGKLLFVGSLAGGKLLFPYFRAGGKLDCAGARGKLEPFAPFSYPFPGRESRRGEGTGDTPPGGLGAGSPPA